MSKKKRPARPRTLSRRAEASVRKLSALHEKLAELSPGGSPSQPVLVESAAVVEVRALREVCARCGEALRVSAHDAVQVDGVALRRVDLACTRCGRGICRYFRVSPTLLH
jgi:ribosomal protein S27AE